MSWDDKRVKQQVEFLIRCEQLDRLRSVFGSQVGWDRLVALLLDLRDLAQRSRFGRDWNRSFCDGRNIALLDGSFQTELSPGTTGLRSIIDGMIGDYAAARERRSRWEDTRDGSRVICAEKQVRIGDQVLKEGVLSLSYCQ